MANTTMFTSLGDVCSLPGKTGHCHSLVDRFYFSNGECKYFTWSGCGGNANNFETRAMCESVCLNTSSPSTTSSSSPTVAIVVVTTLVCLSLALSVFGLYHYHRRTRSKSPSPPSSPKSTSKPSKTTKSAKKLPAKTILITNIAQSVLASDLKERIGALGKIASFDFKPQHISTDSHSPAAAHHSCHVEFKFEDDAKRAVSQLNGIDLKGSTLKVTLCESKSNADTHLKVDGRRRKSTNPFGSPTNSFRRAISGSIPSSAKNKFLSVRMSLSPRLKSLATDDELDEVEKSFMVASDADVPISMDVEEDGEEDRPSTTRSLHDLGSDFFSDGHGGDDGDGGSDDSDALMARAGTLGDGADGAKSMEALKGLVKRMTVDGEMRFDVGWQHRTNTPQNGAGYIGVGMEEEL